MERRQLLALAICLIASIAIPTSGRALDHQAMANRIDQLLAERWAERGLEPAPIAEDAEFLRRAWLDLCGIIPPVNHQDGISGVLDFLNSQDPQKRERLVNELLNKPTHATHLANLWQDVMLPADVDLRRFGGDAGFRNWLYAQFKNNVPYDRTVRELLTAGGNANQTGPVLFYTALQLKPEELAASTSRIFLGTQIQCAQCHDHPFDHWTRRDFWGYAAFFAQLQRPGANRQVAFQVNDADSGEVEIPETGEVVPPKFLGGDVSSDTSASRRSQLADWLTSPENDYFARATVNRIWSLMFGRGLVEPVDDLGLHNPPTHPQLLDELAAYFVQTGFDLNQLFRTLAATRAYSLSSNAPVAGKDVAGEDVDAEDTAHLYVRMAVKSLTAEQLYDCLMEAMRKREQAVAAGQSAGNRTSAPSRQQFLNQFRAPTQGRTEFQAGIPQALTLMNGNVIREATDLAQSDLLAQLDAPFFNNEKRVEILFLSTLSRMPNEQERAIFTDYVEARSAELDRRQAFGDVLWALLNSAEFVFNH